MAERQLPEALVIYPPGTGYYVDREFFALLAGWHTTYAFEDPTVPARFRSGGVRSIPLRCCPLIPGVPVSPLVNRVVCDLSKLVDAVRPSVVITYESFSSISAQVSVSRARHHFKHMIVCYETVPPSRSLWGWFPPTRGFARRACASGDLFVTHTRRAAGVLAELGIRSGDIVVRAPGVYPATEVPPPGTHGGSDREMTVVYLGSLSLNKGIRTLNGAAARLLEDSVVRARLRFEVVGDGPLRAESEALAVRFGPRFRVHGHVSERSKSELLARASVLVYPSVDVRFGPFTRWEEQSGTAVMEAMSAGVPVVGSDSGALPEVIDRAGWVFPQGSVPGLAELLRRLLDDPGERARAAGRARELAASKYSVERCAQDVGAAMSERFPS